MLSVAVKDVHGSKEGVSLTVEDTGVGIPEKNRTRVFEAFFSTRATIGTGIGLFVAKQFVEGHNGKIEMVSSVDPANHGTKMSIFLPVAGPY